MNTGKIQQVIEDTQRNINTTLSLPAQILITNIHLILIVGLLSATDDGLTYLPLKHVLEGFYQPRL